MKTKKLSLALLAVLSLSSLAFSQGGLYQDRAEGRVQFSPYGNALVALPGATVTVCTDSTCATPVTLYSNVALTLPFPTPSNVAFADLNGNFSFYAAPGIYWCTVRTNGFAALSRACQVSTTTAVNGVFTSLLTSSIDTVLYVDGVHYTTIQAAYNALPSSGGWIIIPPGTYTLSSTLNIAKPIHIMGGGYTSLLSTSITPTVVNCTGSGPAFSIVTANASQSVIEGFNLMNTGSCTFGVDLESNTDADVSGVRLENLYISGFTLAGVDIGGNTTLHLTINTILRNVYAANNPTNFLVGFASTTLFDHVIGLN